jgi:hypothetical protein
VALLPVSMPRRTLEMRSSVNGSTAWLASRRGLGLPAILLLVLEGAGAFKGEASRTAISFSSAPRRSTPLVDAATRWTGRIRLTRFRAV